MTSLVRVTLVSWKKKRKSAAQRRQEYFLKEGRCPTCGVHTHEKTRVGFRTQLVPIRNESVQDGRCLMCDPVPPVGRGLDRFDSDGDDGDDSGSAKKQQQPFPPPVSLAETAPKSAAPPPQQVATEVTALSKDDVEGQILVQRAKWALGCAAVLTSVVASVIALLLMIRDFSPEWAPNIGDLVEEEDSAAPTRMPLVAPTPRPTSSSYDEPTASPPTNVRRVIATISDEALLDDPFQPQYKALHWMLAEKEEEPRTEEWAILQRYAMALFYFSTGGETTWIQPRDFLSNLHECKWHPNVKCLGGSGGGGAARWRITHFQFEGGPYQTYNDFGATGLTGQFPNEMAMALPFLRELVITGEELFGTIPSNLGTLQHLRLLDWSSNYQLSGAIPASLGSATILRSLALSETQLEGRIPTTLGLLSELEDLWLGWNWLTGPIPSELGQLSKLDFLYLQRNDFLTGTIPPELGNITTLHVATLHKNNLSGSVPQSLCHLTKWRVLKRLSVDCYLDCSCCTECFDEFGKMVQLSGT